MLKERKISVPKELIAKRTTDSIKKKINPSKITNQSYCNMVTAKPPTGIVWHIPTTKLKAGAFEP